MRGEKPKSVMDEIRSKQVSIREMEETWDKVGDDGDWLEPLIEEEKERIQELSKEIETEIEGSDENDLVESFSVETDGLPEAYFETQEDADEYVSHVLETNPSQEDKISVGRAVVPKDYVYDRKEMLDTKFEKEIEEAEFLKDNAEDFDQSVKEIDAEIKEHPMNDIYESLDDDKKTDFLRTEDSLRALYTTKDKLVMERDELSEQYQEHLEFLHEDPSFDEYIENGHYDEKDVEIALDYIEKYADDDDAVETVDDDFDDDIERSLESLSDNEK